MSFRGAKGVVRGTALAIALGAAAVGAGVSVSAGEPETGLEIDLAGEAGGPEAGLEIDLAGEAGGPETELEIDLTGEADEPETGLAEVSGESAGQTEDAEKKGQSSPVYNLLMIGSDHRDQSWNGNSDVMIVVSINEEEERMRMTSFMRDLYADIPGYGVHKLNYAYAAGGPETLAATLEDNYELLIDNYAIVDFETMAEIVDTVGGVEMEISDAECKVLNGYLTSMNAPEDYLPGGGTYLMNGNQAVAYMRIRYVGNNDYQRTQRQRDVLTEMFASMKELSAGDLAVLAAKIVPLVEHNIDPVEMVRLMSLLPKMAEYELEESRVPYDDLYTSQNEMLVPDFPATIERLHSEIYGD